MEAGMSPHLMIDDAGRLIAFATGSQATTEHECGMATLQRGLTSTAPLSATTTGADLRAFLAGGGAVDQFAYPDLMASKRIRAGAEHWRFAERVVDGVPEAGLVCDVERPVEPFGNPWVERALRLYKNDVAGAWDEGSCGFRVRGAERVAQLRSFAAAIAAGEAIFAGTFLRSSRDGAPMGGVIIAIEALLPTDTRAEMVDAQRAFEADVRLHARSRMAELRELWRKLPIGRSILHIWPVWRDRVVDTDVVYAMNPGLGVKAAYYGPYEFEQLRDWLAAGAEDRLQPIKRAPVKADVAGEVETVSPSAG